VHSELYLSIVKSQCIYTHRRELAQLFRIVYLSRAPGFTSVFSGVSIA